MTVITINALILSLAFRIQHLTEQVDAVETRQSRVDDRLHAAHILLWQCITLGKTLAPVQGEELEARARALNSGGVVFVKPNRSKSFLFRFKELL